jgi:hypothetical protein
MGEGLGVMDPVSRPVTGPQLEHGQLEDLGTVISSVLGEPFVSDVANRAGAARWQPGLGG